MNIFRLLADLFHLFAIIVLLLKIWKTRSCSGISGKSQILFLIVFITRYLDMFINFVSVYNTAMKFFYLGTSIATCYFIYTKFRPTYDQNHDTFRLEFLIVPSVVLALVINHDFSILEIMWTFSIYLEAVAIFPQLFMLQTTGSAETITAHYLFCLGIYRALYVCNWIYRYYDEDHFDSIAIIAGIVQTVLYSDFFFLYVRKVVQQNRNIELSA
uniref:ER lumen protein-retaining receptor n=1 Tax=Rhabditophanes sp. KR3021 TaxID=114890 RepID=A0AC35TZ10_9BILA